MVNTNTDICVVGGGMAGVCAALAAARHGATVALVQDRPVLGGNASSEIRMHICGADHQDNVWRETGILEELRLESLLHNDGHNPNQLDLALYDACRRQPNLRLFLNAQVTGCNADLGRVVSCEARELTSDRQLTFEAQYFIDASGDGALAHAAGAEFMHGREGRDKYNESLAPEKGDDCTLGHSILFQAKDAGRTVPFRAPDWAIKFKDEDLPHRGHGGAFGFWWIEWGGTMDTITDSEAIKDELLAAALGLWDHMKNGGDHGVANYALEWIGFIPGRRESRRFIGDHVLTQQDLQSGRQFPDQIAYGGWPIDTHPPLGFRSPEPPCTQTRLDEPYGIPLRSCYCKGFENLLLAGRNISASHIAFASTRIMASCALIGQGVGTTAALAARTGATIPQMAKSHMNEVQQTLLRDGCYLLEARNSDPADLARKARVTTSSELGPGFRAANVTDGCNHPEPGASHCWRSASLPASLELRWPSPVKLGKVQLVLDTDFEHRLTMTQSESYRKTVAPVPRSVTPRDLTVEVETEGRWRQVALIKDNYQRLLRIDIPQLTASAVRIAVQSAWGVEYASILEVRCSI